MQGWWWACWRWERECHPRWGCRRCACCPGCASLPGSPRWRAAEVCPCLHHALMCCVPASGAALNPFHMLSAAVLALYHCRGVHAGRRQRCTLATHLTTAGSAALAPHCQVCSLCASRSQGGADACLFITLRDGQFCQPHSPSYRSCAGQSPGLSRLRIAATIDSVHPPRCLWAQCVTAVWLAGGLNQILSGLALRVPSSVLSRLPSDMALKIRTMSQQTGEQLPTHAAMQASLRK